MEEVTTGCYLVFSGGLQLITTGTHSDNSSKLHQVTRKSCCLEQVELSPCLCFCGAARVEQFLLSSPQMKCKNEPDIFPHFCWPHQSVSVGIVCLGMMVSAGQTDRAALDIHTLCVVAPGMFILSSDALGEARHCTLHLLPSPVTLFPLLSPCHLVPSYALLTVFPCHFVPSSALLTLFPLLSPHNLFPLLSPCSFPCAAYLVLSPVILFPLMYSLLCSLSFVILFPLLSLLTLFPLLSLLTLFSLLHCLSYSFYCTPVHMNNPAQVLKFPPSNMMYSLFTTTHSLTQSLTHKLGLFF
ncbi:hypothetical protein E2C01_065030 [Portunus trituberculatus]|uniref:Uncharacterized protein n=1 Tax=Portunus trituberculatus TaxID=210409 RepID=A0A5B7HKS8_PORTR|nr:hypothetical protein [Portunus trituberculatus]